jgi:tRNA(adenine34) deaminase
MEDWSDQRLMRLAIAEAQAAAQLDEVPIGCVILHQPSSKIIARAFNRRITQNDATAHAEILAIRQAAAALQDWRLIDCRMAVTLEPCPMCAGAIVNARIPLLIYGCDDPKAGAVRSLYRLCEDARLNHHAEIRAGVLAEECAELLREFFAAKRAMGKK